MWPTDRLLLVYAVATGVAVSREAAKISHAGVLVALHLLACSLIVLAVRLPESRPVAVFRHWYPVLYLAAMYKEIGLVIDAYGRPEQDPILVGLDLAIWHAYPTLWLEGLQSRALTEFFQIIYSLYLPAILVVPALLWYQRRYSAFRYYGFVLTLGCLSLYIGYFLVPARGPRFWLAPLQNSQLDGLWLFPWVRHAQNWIESHDDCFPSGHTALTLLALWSSAQLSRNFFRCFAVYSVCIVTSTVYLRYHYTVDVLAGVALATVLWAAAPRIYGRFQRRSSSPWLNSSNAES